MNFKERDMIELFSRLRDWEDTHIRKFSEIRATLEESEATESYAGELASYVKSTVDDILYKQISKEWFSKNVLKPLTAIEYGIGFEKTRYYFSTNF